MRVESYGLSRGDTLREARERSFMLVPIGMELRDIVRGDGTTRQLYIARGDNAAAQRRSLAGELRRIGLPEIADKVASAGRREFRELRELADVLDPPHRREDDYIALPVKASMRAHESMHWRRAAVRRPRTRRSHRVVRVAKTAAGDSGDPDPEPPTTRRTATIGGAP